MGRARRASRAWATRPADPAERGDHPGGEQVEVDQGDRDRQHLEAEQLVEPQALREPLAAGEEERGLLAADRDDRHDRHVMGHRVRVGAEEERGAALLPGRRRDPAVEVAGRAAERTCRVVLVHLQAELAQVGDAEVVDLALAPGRARLAHELQEQLEHSLRDRGHRATRWRRSPSRPSRDDRARRPPHR